MPDCSRPSVDRMPASTSVGGVLARRAPQGPEVGATRRDGRPSGAPWPSACRRWPRRAGAARAATWPARTSARRPIPPPASPSPRRAAPTMASAIDNAPSHRRDVVDRRPPDPQHARAAGRRCRWVVEEGPAARCGTRRRPWRVSTSGLVEVETTGPGGGQNIGYDQGGRLPRPRRAQERASAARARPRPTRPPPRRGRRRHPRPTTRRDAMLAARGAARSSSSTTSTRVARLSTRRRHADRAAAADGHVVVARRRVVRERDASIAGDDGARRAPQRRRRRVRRGASAWCLTWASKPSVMVCDPIREGVLQSCRHRVGRRWWM